MFNELAFQARPHIVVQDNVPFHKTAEVKAVFEEGRCHHQQEFVPAWSPQLNMIEECWSKVESICQGGYTERPRHIAEVGRGWTELNH